MSPAGRLCAPVIMPTRCSRMLIEVTMPELDLPAGADWRLSAWFVSEGEVVYEAEPLVEIMLPAAALELPAPITGRLARIDVYPDDPVRPGQVLGLIEVCSEVLRTHSGAADGL
ncbi:MAG: hypothetical protein C4297_09925 [Gemmataceae bacterium]